MDDLEERLNNHDKAFEGLLSLIPAKHYYGEDTSDQWQRKKQSKEQKRQNKRAKLNPDTFKSAKDVLDENEKKRRREVEGQDDSQEQFGSSMEQPREGMKDKSKTKKAKKATKGAEEKATVEDVGTERGTKVKHGKSDKPTKRTPKSETQLHEGTSEEKRNNKKQSKISRKDQKNFKSDAIMPTDDTSDTKAEEVGEDADLEDKDDEDGMSGMDLSGLVEAKENPFGTSVSPSPERDSPTSITSGAQSSSSISSIVPPESDLNHKAQAATEETGKDGAEQSRKATNPNIPRKIVIPKIDPEILKARLQSRIEELRAARKADGLDGKPARNRQELLEARRRKQEQRKAHKKELRKQAKEDEKRAATEAELAQLRGSGSPLTPDIFSSPRREEIPNNFSFGTITFDDGEQVDSSLQTTYDVRKKKGPQDAKTALEAAEKKRARINGLDEAERNDIEEKDAWLRARKRAHGEKLKDDTNLLKKTLKRKENSKRKSEREWTSRIEGVAKGKEMRQQKREDNLRKRKEEKHTKSKKPNKSKVTKRKPKGRPGFEGSFGARGSK